MKGTFRKIAVALLMGSGVVCLVGAAALAGYNIWDEKRAEESVVTDVAALAQVIPEKKTEEQPIVPEFQVMMTEMELDESRYVGLVDIPAIERSLPVQSECTERKLKHSPCLYQGTIYDGMIIAGHNYRSHFSPLKKLVIGDEVFFTDVEGNVWRYTVAMTEVIDGYDVEGMEAGDWDLTLFTCTYSGEERFTVRCNMEFDLSPR